MLKSLELFGFKSFADRTRFDFSAGITGVVGPNGSGKSNVVDGIKWILGDQSPKSLRGKEMTDVIFNGSATRKPAGFTEATLTFDNTKRVLSIDSDEVQVGRRLYRSGESEYLINRMPSRLKEVRDLFLGTGAGSSAYSIIEQGRVDQLLQATNQNRRMVFEEAAGISRFKAKKVDAQRKLERVSQNLVRLTDIVQEVEKQLHQVRSQATRATRYRSLSLELRTLRLGLAADDFRRMNQLTEQSEQEKAQLAAQIEQFAADAHTTEQQQREFEQRISQVEDRLRDAEHRAAENREEIAGLEATLHHQEQRRHELETEAQRLQTQQQELLARVEEVSGEWEQTVGHLTQFQAEFLRRKEELTGRLLALSELEQRLDRGRAEIETVRQAQLEQLRMSSVFENRIATASAQRDGTIDLREKAIARLARLESELKRLETAYSQQQQAVAAAQAGTEKSRDQLATAQQQRQEILSRQASAQQALLELREQRSATLARRTILEDLELRQEGLGVGVKEILARAKADPSSPWSSVRGHVVDLLDVDLEHAALVEVALGARAQLIVLNDAGPFLDFLSEGSCPISGRVGFLAVQGEEPDLLFREIPSRNEQIDWPDLSAAEGVVSRADQLVKVSRLGPKLTSVLLSDTWIVRTLDDALRLAQDCTAPCRFVTLQGELLDNNGVLYVGTVRSETALVSRRSELRGIKQELTRLDRKIQSQEQAIQTAARELRDCEKELERLRGECDRGVVKISEARAVAAGLELELDRGQREQEDVREEVRRTDELLLQAEERCRSATIELEQARGAQERLQGELSEREQQLAADDAELQSQRELTLLEQRTLAQQEERLRNLEQARTRLDQERLQRDLHREEADRRLAFLQLRQEQIDREIGNTDQRLSTLREQREVLTGEVQALQAEREETRKVRGDVNDQEFRQRQFLRDLKERQHAVQMQHSETRHQLTSLIERIHDEFQIDLAELVLTEISARSAWEQVQRLEKVDDGDGESHREAGHHDAARKHGGSDSHESQHSIEGIDDAALHGMIEERISRCRRRLKALGQVNTESLNELEELEARYGRLSSQLQDLVEARNTLDEIIRRINNESRRLFTQTFQEIRIQFQELFRKLFGGGEGDVVLEDPDDMLECGIDIVARPPGKELRSISLLSGGEKTMTAVALLLAIFQSRPSPFCVLDEVDAALDEGNIERYMNVIKEFQSFTQFIVITHNKRTMSTADVLYGVTMEEAGVSKRMSVRFDDITEDGHFVGEATGGAPAADGDQNISAA